MQDSNLGFSDSSIVRKICVKASEDGTLWYFWDNKEGKIPIKKNSLTGYLKDLKVRRYQSSFGESDKLHVYMYAEENFCIQSGLDTWFSKSLLSSLTTLNLIQCAITISVKNPPNSPIVFANLYIGDNWIQPDYSWKKTSEPDWVAVVESIQSRIRFKDMPF